MSRARPRRRVRRRAAARGSRRAEARRAWSTCIAACSAPTPTTTRSRYQPASSSSWASSSSRSAPRWARLNALLGFAGRQLEPSHLDLLELLRLDAALARALEQRCRGLGRLECRLAVGRAGLGEERLAAPGGAWDRAAARAGRAVRPRPARARHAAPSGELGRAHVDRLADRPIGEARERHELAARADRLRDRPEVVGDEDDHRVGGRFLEILEQRVGGVLVHQMRAEHKVDAPVGLERPHVEVAAQLADRVDPDHLAERVELVQVGVNRARRAEQLLPEGARERPFADPGRPVEEVGVRPAPRRAPLRGGALPPSAR